MSTAAGLTGPALYFTLVLITVVVLCLIGFFVSVARNNPVGQHDETASRHVVDLAAHRLDRAGAEIGKPADRWAE